MTADRLGEVRVRLSTDDGASEDVVVRATPDARAGDLAEAASARFGLDGRCDLLMADGSKADAMQHLSELPIRHGDRLLLAAEGCGSSGPPAALDPAWELVGPDRGSGQWPARLVPGRYEIGRDRSTNDIVLDDPSVSRRHATLDVGGVVSVADRGSTNGTWVADEPVAGRSTVGDRAEIRFGDVMVRLRRIAGPPELRASEAPTIRFNRPPKVRRTVEAVTFRLPDPPMPAARPRVPWLTAAVPAIMALALIGFSLVSDDPSFGGSFLWMSAGFLLLSPVMVLATHVESRRGARSDERRAGDAFADELAVVSERAVEALSAEALVRSTSDPGAVELRRRVLDRDERLWDDGGSDWRMRVGSASLPSAITIERAARPTDPAQAAAVEQVVARFATVDDAPVIVEGAAIGVVGAAEPCTAIARWLVVQMATRRPPSALGILVLASPEEAPEWQWVKWLPGGRAGDRQWCRRVFCDRAGVAGVLSSDAAAPQLVIVTATAPIEPAELAALIDQRSSCTGAVVVLADDRESLPSGCAVIVEAGRSGRRTMWSSGLSTTGRVTFAESGRVVDPVRLDGVTLDEADSWARALAPLLEEVAARRNGGLPVRVELSAAMGVPTDALTDPERIAARWADDAPSLIADIGVSERGPLSIDLRRDGPHGIIAGTTGAGKSELLQTIVASLAARYPPSRVTFLLIDYKGGAAFADCVGLPHTVGLITDLDDHLVDRVMRSLGAELRRRERILAAVGAKDLATMEATGNAEAPPSLVIAVDEFASLTADVPGFLDGMVDIARRGRSLGVHLLLATQRPAGVVSEQLRANANLRVALRVADAADSTDVVGVPDASAIPRGRPGRAIVRVGDGDVVEFQAAHCGRRRATEAATRTPIVELLPFDATVPPVRLDADVLGAPSDLQRLVEAAQSAALLVGEPRPRRPWLAPLPDRIALGGLLPDWLEHRGLVDVLVGVADEPGRQAQHACAVDLDRVGSIGVFGSGGVAPRRCAEAMVLSALVGRPPSELRVDAVTCGASVLGELAQFPQVGSVLDVDDTERVERLIRQLDADVRRGATRGGPRRLLLIDNFAAFAARLDGLEGPALVDVVARLIADGSASRVNVIVTADRRSAVPIAVASSIGERVVMAMAADDEYGWFGIDGSMLASGRVVDGVGSARAVVGGLLVQTPTIDTEGEWAVAAIADRECARWPGQRAMPIGALPASVCAASIPVHRNGDAVALVGVDDRDLSPATVDLGAGNLLVAGPLRSGRTTALCTLASSLPEQVQRILVAGRDGPVVRTERIGPWDLVLSGSDLADQVHEVRGRLAGVDAPTVVFVDDACDLDEAADDALDRWVADLRDGPVRLVVAAEAALARTAYGGLLARMRRERRALLLQPDAELDGDLAGVRLPRRRRSLPPGRGELVERGRIRLVQVALPMGDAPHGTDSTDFLR